MVPSGAIRLRVEGKHVLAQEKSLGPDEATEGIEITTHPIAPEVRKSVVIRTAQSIPPSTAGMMQWTKTHSSRETTRSFIHSMRG
jgi:hypothetical protein